MRQRGSALISALLIVAITASIGVTMALQQQGQIQTQGLVKNQARARLAMDSMRLRATSWLAQNLIQNNPKKFAVDPLPKQLQSPPVSGETVQGNISDAQGQFNLNNLLDNKNKPAFVRLLLTVIPNWSKANAQALATALVARLAWTQPPGNQRVPLADISELKQFPELSATAFEQLKPFITALPQITPININAASVPVLLTISPHLTNKEALAIKASVLQHGRYHTLTQFLSSRVAKQANLSKKGLTLNSQYFYLDATLPLSQQHYGSHTLLYRSQRRQQVTVAPLWQYWEFG